MRFQRILHEMPEVSLALSDTGKLLLRVQYGLPGVGQLSLGTRQVNFQAFAAFDCLRKLGWPGHGVLRKQVVCHPG